MGLLEGLRFGSKEALEAKRNKGGLNKVGGEQPRKKVGDGGAAFRAAALKRATEEARKSGRSLQEVVAERYGTIEDLLGDDAEAVRAASLRPARAGRSRAIKGVKKFQPDDREQGRRRENASDADVLRKYSAKLETALDGYVKGEVAQPQKDDDEDNKWVGLNKHTSLGMHSNMDDLFANKKRRQEEEHGGRQEQQHGAKKKRGGAPPAPAPREKAPVGRPLEEGTWAQAMAQQKKEQKRPAEDADVASARRDGGGGGNTDIAAMLRAKLG